MKGDDSVSNGKQQTNNIGGHSPIFHLILGATGMSPAW